MYIFFRRAWLVSLCVLGQAGSVGPLKAEAPPAATPSFSLEEEKAREAVLNSDEWIATRHKFDSWLAVQAAYDPDQVNRMRQEFTTRIARMSPTELSAFLLDMQRRLDVLMSPEVTAARNWADGLYTLKGKRELTAEYNLSDPLSMSPEELTAALQQFAADRQSRGAAQAAFLKSQTAQSEAVVQNERRQASAAAASPSRAGTFPTPSISNRAARPQRYEAPYNPVRYTIGPWGGVWVGH